MLVFCEAACVVCWGWVAGLTSSTVSCCLLAGGGVDPWPWGTPPLTTSSFRLGTELMPGLVVGCCEFGVPPWRILLICWFGWAWICCCLTSWALTLVTGLLCCWGTLLLSSITLGLGALSSITLAGFGCEVRSIIWGCWVLAGVLGLTAPCWTDLTWATWVLLALGGWTWVTIKGCFWGGSEVVVVDAGVIICDVAGAGNVLKGTLAIASI